MRIAVDDDIDVEARDLGAADHAVAGAVHAALDAGERHDRIPRLRGGRNQQGQERGEAHRKARSEHGSPEQ